MHYTKQPGWRYTIYLRLWQQGASKLTREDVEAGVPPCSSATVDLSPAVSPGVETSAAEAASKPLEPPP